MRPAAPYVARHVDRAPNPAESRTAFDLVTALFGLVGVALFGIGLVEDRGSIWPAMGVVVCVAVVAVSGSNLMPSTMSERSGGE